MTDVEITGTKRPEGAIPVIIPAFEPDRRLLRLVDDLFRADVREIVLVDDGSGADFQQIFKEAEERGCIVLVHDENRGKGRALKTAFAECLRRYPDLIGCVTADSDGQHCAADIRRVIDQLTCGKNRLILGSRDFAAGNVPWKSRFGNRITRFICRHYLRLRVEDTQTGLRGIPATLMRDCLALPGERFEFEMQMLLYCRGRYDMEEISIRTIYDSAEHHSTHFHPVRDSIRVYSALFNRRL